MGKERDWGRERRVGFRKQEGPHPDSSPCPQPTSEFRNTWDKYHRYPSYVESKI